MVQFFKSELELREAPSAILPRDHKVSQLLKFAQATRMQRDVFFPSVSSSPLLTSYVGNDEPTVHSSSNATAVRFSCNSGYTDGGCFISSGTTTDSFRDQGFSHTYLRSPTLTSGLAVAPITISSGNSDSLMGTTMANSRISNSTQAHSETIRESGKCAICADPASKEAAAITDKHLSKRQKTSHVEKHLPSPSDGLALVGNRRMNVAPVRKSQKLGDKKSQKLGDKITALQQLVSPLGKTDTASVLYEASICIKVLHEQVQVLTGPYFPCRIKTSLQGTESESASLQSRGLCLLPISTTIVNFANEEHTRNNDPERFTGRVGRKSL